MTLALGLDLSRRNAVWTRNALPSLRALQQALLADGLRCEPAARTLALHALELVEEQVQWRLRLLQMQDLTPALVEHASAHATDPDDTGPPVGRDMEAFGHG